MHYNRQVGKWFEQCLGGCSSSCRMVLHVTQPRQSERQFTSHWITKAGWSLHYHYTRDGFTIMPACVDGPTILALEAA